MNLKNLKCWIITEGMAGTENQCLGVTDALGIEPEVRRIKLRQPWTSLSPWLGFEQRSAFIPELKPPWPGLLITSGRKAVAASRYIKRKSHGKTLTVHIQDPRISARNFDLLAVPAHDPARGDNVLVTTGAPNRITQERLEKAQKDFPEFETLKSPRVAVLIGGGSKAYTLDKRTLQKTIDQLKQLDAGLMITASRRTGIENEKLLKDQLSGPDSFIWDGKGQNPYFAMLGWADFILVTADSVSMLSEACTTGKPVYMIDLPGGTERIKALHNNLMNQGALKKFSGVLESWNYPLLNDAQKIADKIYNLIKSRG